MKILIVDDESHVIEGMTNHIPWKQWDVDEIQTAQNGIEAWEVFQQFNPDLVITDIIMPRMNGLEFIKLLRENNKKVPIVILSGHDDFAFAKKAIELEVSHYILKPIVSKEIMIVLQQIFDEINAKQKQEDWIQHIGTYVNENVASLREQFINDLIARGVRNVNLNKTNLEMLEVSEDIKSGGRVLTLQLFPPTNHIHSYNSTDWQLLKYAAKNISEEILVGYSSSIYITYFMDYRLSILWIDKDPEKLLDKVKAAANLIIKNIHRYLKLESNIGLGHWYKDIEQYIDSYRESITALKYGEYEGYQRVDVIENTSNINQAWPSYPIEDMQKITEAILHRDSELCKKLWGEFIKTIVEQNASMEYIQSVCIGLINSIIIQLKETKSSKGLSIAFSALQHIQQMKTKQKLLVQTENTIIEIMDAIQTNLTQGPEYYVDFVIQYISQNYSHSITFGELANELHLSRVYLGNLFKKATGETFVNYLTKYRIEQAKKLIISKNFMIFEVAEMVGFTDSAYFSRVFKNYTGNTPTEYLVKVDKEHLSEKRD